MVHTFSWGNSYGPMVLKVLLKFPPTLVLVHGWLFPEDAVCERSNWNFVESLRKRWSINVSMELGKFLVSRERKISPKFFFQPEVFSWTSARVVRPKMRVFPAFGGPDRSFWPDVRRDIRPKNSSLG